MSILERIERALQGLWGHGEPRLSAADPYDDDPAWGGGGGGATEVTPSVDRLEGEVVAILKDFEQVHVRTAEGRVLAITPQTPGVEFASLHRGQRIACTVTRYLPRVLNAKVLA